MLLLLESAIADKNKKAVDIQLKEAVSSVGEKKISKPRKPRAKKGIIIFFITIVFNIYMYSILQCYLLTNRRMYL
jgi:hypothetical protein